MSREGSLGALLQGVSQQPPAVRPSGKVTEQVNFTSDIVQGLTVRPALVEHGIASGEANGDYRFFDAQIDGTTYIFGVRPGSIKAWDTSGTPVTITLDDGAVASYVGYNMQPYVFDKTLYVANRDTVVAKAAGPVTTSHYAGAGIAYCLGGLFSRTYSVTIRYDDATEAVGSYTTPDGTSSGDAALASSDNIISEIETSLAAHANFKAGTTLTVSDRTLLVHDTTNAYTLSADDEEDGSTMRAFTTSTDDIEDLSETAPHGMVVRITNSDEGGSDDYYMRFNSDITDTVGSGFGDGGVWEEWYNVDEVVEFDLTTMPHAITATTPTELLLSKGAWKQRQVGDETTNAFPSIVGYAIRDIGGFQSRIVMVAGPNCVMSRTNDEVDLFKKSALTEIDSDPIDIRSTEEGVQSIDWIIPFDRDLVLMSDPGDGQFIISGSNKLTANNASMVTTTSFEMKGGAKPVETGRTILFPFQSGMFSGIKEFFTNDEVATNGADTITETVDRFITGLVDNMKCSTNFNMAMFKTANPDYDKTLFVYKYLWQNSDKLQSSWSTWQVPEKLEYFFFDGSQLFVVMSKDNDVSGTDYLFDSLDLDIPVDAVTGFHICLDRQRTVVADGSFEVTIPVSGAAFAQSTGCAQVGQQVQETQVVDNGDGTHTYTFNENDVPAGATVVAGVKYARRVKPTMPYIRDQNGNVVPRTHLIINAFLMEYVDTGYFSVTLSSRYRGEDTVMVWDWFSMDDDPDDPNVNGIRSGILDIPWGERSDWSEITISSDDIRPTTIIELEWTGEAFKGSRG